MNKKNCIASFAIAVAMFSLAGSVHAQDIADGAANIQPQVTFRQLIDARPLRLRSFLRSHGSPLETEADTFIREADTYNLNWKLVAAIAGVESTFGLHIPSGSYNAWGWGIPTGAQSGVAFGSWKDGIHTVTQGIRENYVNHGAVTLEQIGAIYAASPAWAGHVQQFLDEIENYTPTDPASLQVNI